MTNTFPPDTTGFLKDLERAGNAKPILMVDGNDTPVIFEAGAQLDLATMATYGGNRGEGSLYSRFEEEYKKKFGNEPESLQTALGYDLVMVVAAAVKQAQSTDGEAVAKALNSLEGVEGATGLITYKDSPLGRGLPKKDYAITTFDRANKKFVVQEMVFPEKIPVER
jgi:branched-chain amino acid transport system substrate-binding protein